MELIVVCWLALAVLEAGLWWPPIWHWHRVLAIGFLPVLGLANLALLVSHPSAWVILLNIFSLYRLINLSRLVKNRLQADYLYRTGRQTSWWLLGLQLSLGTLEWFSAHYHASAAFWLYVTAGLQAGVASILWLTVHRQLRTTRAPAVPNGLADRDLPSLTVAIPARNETAALEDCLQSLTASTYPKLEILVLDDCSQNKRTPEVIRSFAHAGVRFIAGQVPPPHWLAKNYAYQQLVQSASGELLLFCGVDTRFEPEALTNLVKLLLHKHKGMLSLLPRNQPVTVTDHGPTLRSRLVQSARYAWELALPRRLLGRPPVLSTCWLIRRQLLEDAGGLAAVAGQTIPERYLAGQAARQGDQYSFMQAGRRLGITSRKSFHDQQATAIRTRYPQLHRRPELVGLISLAETITLALPFAMVLVAALTGRAWLLGLSLLTCWLNLSWYSRLTRLTYPGAGLAGWLLPLAALYDVVLLNYSMWQYEFDEVIWKGRNVCLPVLQVLPSLPYVPPSGPAATAGRAPRS